MSKKQRYIILSLVILIIGYGLINDKMKDKAQDTFAFYILRAEGDAYIMDDQPIFTGKDVFSYNSSTREFIFTGNFKRKMDEGEFITHTYKDYNDKIIEPEGYWINGVSPLGAVYPDQFLITIDGHKVLEGYFQTPPYMSYIPHGDFVSLTEEGIKLIPDYESVSLVIEPATQEPVSTINMEEQRITDPELLAAYNKMQDYFENH